MDALERANSDEYPANVLGDAARHLETWMAFDGAGIRRRVLGMIPTTACVADRATDETTWALVEAFGIRTASLVRARKEVRQRLVDVDKTALDNALSVAVEQLKVRGRMVEREREYEQQGDE